MLRLCLRPAHCVLRVASCAPCVLRTMMIVVFMGCCESVKDAVCEVIGEGRGEERGERRGEVVPAA